LGEKIFLNILGALKLVLNVLKGPGMKTCIETVQFSGMTFSVI
jgi:hypothetical protein